MSLRSRNDGLFQQVVRLVVDLAIRGDESPHHELRRTYAVDREQHVVEHRQPGEQAGDLERARHPERGAPVARPAGDVRPNSSTCPDVGGKDSGDEIEQRGLAGAVRSDDGLAVARHDLQRDAAHGVQAAEAFRQSSELQNGVDRSEARHSFTLDSPLDEKGPGPVRAPVRRCCQQCLQGGKSRL